MRDYWRPALTAPATYGHRPEVGALISFDRQAWRVVEIFERKPVDWSEQASEYWRGAGMPDPWPRAPYVAVIRPAQGGKSRHLGVEPWHLGWWQPIPEHYAVCVACGELSPCREITFEQAAKREMERFDTLAKIMPGCCWACSEPITSRQKAYSFPGPNVWMPTAPEGVRIHQRRACWSTAERYEEDWVKADPTRARSFLTLRCKGTLVVHHDGSGECFGAEESDCPGLRARHGSSTACYGQSLGCPRGCSREGHPGARLSIGKAGSA